MEGSSDLREDEDDGMIMIRMDIKEPLETLKSILVETFPGVANHKFTLLDGPELDGRKSLVQHGVQGEGEVVVNLEIREDEKGKRLDIVDVLKPADDDLLDLDDADVQSQQTTTAHPERATEKPAIGSTERKRPRQRKKKPVASKSDNIMMEKPKTPQKTPTKTEPTETSDRPSSSQVQLWQFLLELLTDYTHLNSIQWLGKDGEFQMLDPEMVAKLWGIRKNNPHMNYEKMSRALRYYYNGDMIAKVTGRRFVFKFVCDLKFMLGYNSSELNAFVHEAAIAAKKQDGGSTTDRSRPIIVESDYYS